MKSRAPRAVFASAVALSVGASLLFPACAGNPTCVDYGNCAESGGSNPSGGSGSGGKAGSSARAGNGAIGGAGGDAGASGASGTDDGGMGGAAAGAAGSAGEPPCSDDCSGATPICDPARELCVECLVATDCRDSAKPYCDTAAAKCVACSKQSECSDPVASTCTAGACTACKADADCSNITGKGVCDAGTCVQCTGKKFAACGMDAGTPLVCDSLKRICTTSKQQSAGLCVACVTDAQCKLGQACVLDKFGSPVKDVGYFCHWKKGDAAHGAPADCFSTGKPYAGTQVDVTSIDGSVSDICGLRSSTCIANNQFSALDCSVASAPSDSACGVAPPKDAKCAQVPSSSSYRCTMTCLSDEDCPGTSCDTGVSPRVCAFN